MLSIVSAVFIIGGYIDCMNLLNRHGIATSISVMCFGSLGTVHKNVRGNLKRLGLSGEEAKETMEWCCVSNMICGSIIWRNRCEKCMDSRTADFW